MKRCVSLIMALALIMSLSACGGGTTGGTTTTYSAAPAAVTPAASTESKTPPPMPEESESAPQAPEQHETHHVKIEVENYGTISLELDASSAPATVENFLTLAGQGFYDGLTFHRIIDGFMIQGGDPDGNGTGGSDRKIPGEFLANGYDNRISHVRGIISMARAPKDFDSASSQFFIVQADSTSLDGQYAAFGHVIEGMEVVDAICADAQPVDENGTILPDAQPVITSVTVTD